MQQAIPEYGYATAAPTWSSHYVWRPLCGILQARLEAGARVFDLGCGNGATASKLSGLGFAVTAVDPSASGIAAASAAFPNVRFSVRSDSDDLAGEFGLFDAVVSLEVVEHCYRPRQFADSILALLKPGGVAVISTPFHGYWKNLALAVTGRMDAHWAPLWDGGHIKFWSERTLRALLQERGFEHISFRRVGRIPVIAKSMVAVARKPARGGATCAA